MINEQTLVENGFRKYVGQAKFDNSPFCIASYQKRIVDENGVMFFLNFNQFNMKHILPNNALARHEFSAFAQLQTDEATSKTFDVNLHVNAVEMDLSEVQNFFTKMWQAMSCHYSD